MTQEQQTTLVAEFQKMFGDKCFDTTSVLLKASVCPKFAMAIVAAIPNCGNRRTGRPRKALVRRALNDLAQKHFTTDPGGWWHCAAPTEEQT
jgi:hypothetical protein